TTRVPATSNAWHDTWGTTPTRSRARWNACSMRWTPRRTTHARQTVDQRHGALAPARLRRMSECVRSCRATDRRVRGFAGVRADGGARATRPTHTLAALAHD